MESCSNKASTCDRDSALNNTAETRESALLFIARNSDRQMSLNDELIESLREKWSLTVINVDEPYDGKPLSAEAAATLKIGEAEYLVDIHNELNVNKLFNDLATADNLPVKIIKALPLAFTNNDTLYNGNSH